MGFVLYIMRFLAALLFSTLGTSIVFAEPQNVAANIGSSAFKNNYLWHYQASRLEWARAELAECEANGGCSQSKIESRKRRIAYFEGLDRHTDRALRSACDADPTSALCQAYIADACCAAEQGSIASCGGVPSFGNGQRWGYRALMVSDNINRFKAGRRESPRYAIDFAIRSHQENVLNLLKAYKGAVDANKTNNAIGTVIDLGLGAAATRIRPSKAGTIKTGAGSFGQRRFEEALSLKIDGVFSAPKRGDDVVYRGDTRAPDEIFNDGFQPRNPGSDTSLEDYVDYNAPSDYVGTTTNRPTGDSSIEESPEAFGTRHGDQDGFVYEIDRPSNGVDVNSQYPDGPFPNENEIAVPGGVDPSCIRGCTPVGPDGSATGDFIPNPNYTGDN